MREVTTQVTAYIHHVTAFPSDFHVHNLLFQEKKKKKKTSRENKEALCYARTRAGPEGVHTLYAADT